MDKSVLTNPSTIIKIISVALFALVPVFFLPFAWVSVLQSKMLLVSVLMLAAAIAHAIITYRDSVIAFPRSMLSLAVLSLPIIYTLSALFSGASPASFVSGMGQQDTVTTMILFYAIFLHVALSFNGAREASTTFFRSFLAGALVLMLIQVFHVVFPSVTLGVLAAAAASVFGSWHEVGIIAGACIFFTLALWRTPILSSHWRSLALLLSVLSAFMLVIVNMIDVWYSVGILMLLFALYTWYAARRAGLLQVIVAVFIGVAALSGGFFASTVYEGLPSKLQVLQVEVRPSWRGTFDISRGSVQGVRTALLGTGPNTFTQQWSLYKPLGINSTEFWNVDFNTGAGFIPTTFVTVGALGLLSWLAVLGALLWSSRRFLIAVDDGPRTASYAALFGGALYLAAFHVLYVPTVSLSVLTFLVLGVAAAAEGNRSWRFSLRSGTWKDRSRVVLTALALLVVALASLNALRATVSDILVNRSAVVYAADQNTERALGLLQKALLLYPSNDRGHRAAVEIGLRRLGELVASGNTADQTTATLQVSLETTIQHGLAAVSINSSDYQNWLALATLYRDLAGVGVQGAFESAQAAYAEAYQDNPLNPIPLVQMAQLHIAQNNLDEARVLLDKAIGLKIDFAAAYLLRSNVLATQKNTAAAIRDADAVVRIAPEDALGWYNLGAILHNTGAYEPASQALERAIALKNDYGDAILVLGLTYDKLGRSEEALVLLERIAEANPSDEGLKTMIANIRGGRPASGTSEQ